MSHSVEVIRQAEQSTSNWSGGTTTQIAIYPKDALYSERNFSWRLSSANVELEESVFTSLPGIWRLIMVLEGEMRLEHAGHHSSYLQPFDQDSFSGDWTTKSFGKVRDFNLMLAAGCSGELAPVNFKPESTMNESISSPGDAFTKKTTAWYCVDGAVSIGLTADETYELHPGDVLLVHTDKQTSHLAAVLTNTQSKPARLVKASIQHNQN